MDPPGYRTPESGDHDSEADEARNGGVADLDRLFADDTSSVGPDEGDPSPDVRGALTDSERADWHRASAPPDQPGDEARLRELVERPEVSSAIDEAWARSEADDRNRRHEEGGWIVSDAMSGEVRVVPVAPGVRDGINPGSAPSTGPSESVEAFYHTHPNPPVDENGEEWEQGPSPTDMGWSEAHGVPVVVRNASDTLLYYPSSRGLL